MAHATLRHIPLSLHGNKGCAQAKSTMPVSPMDMDDLVKAVIAHFENMDTETRVLLPLVKVYWPA